MTDPTTNRTAPPRRGETGYDSPVAVEARLALAVEMLDAAVAELRGLMSQLQTTTTTTVTTSRAMNPEGPPK